jgi:uncharacterized membrane protein YbjE (DUF340 family)
MITVKTSNDLLILSLVIIVLAFIVGVILGAYLVFPSKELSLVIIVLIFILGILIGEYLVLWAKGVA